MCEGRMTACEDQPQAVVGDFIPVVIRFLDGTDKTGVDVGFKFLFESYSAPNAVYRLILGGFDDPGTRDVGDSGRWPLVDSGGKGFLSSLFGYVEIAEAANESSDNSAPVSPINLIDSRVSLMEHVI